MALITTSKKDRAVLEQQTARELASTLGRNPTQQEIYQVAYNSPYPVFSDEYGVPEARAKLQEYADNMFDAYGNIRKGVLDPTTDKRYRGQIESVISEDMYDPLTRRRLIAGIMKQRETARNNQIAQRMNQYASERSRAVWDYGQAVGEQNMAAEAASKAEQDLLDYQQKMASSRRRSSDKDSSDDIEQAQAYLDYILNSKGEFTIKNVPSKYKNLVIALGNEQMQNSQTIDIPSYEEYAKSISGQNIDSSPFDPRSVLFNDEYSKYSTLVDEANQYNNEIEQQKNYFYGIDEESDDELSQLINTWDDEKDG